MAAGPGNTLTTEQPAIRRWFDAMGAVDVIDWRCVEQPSAQYPAGRWEALLEIPIQYRCCGGTDTAWFLAPPEVLP